MVDTQFLLSALWICLTFSLILADLMRLLSGDHKPGEVGGRRMAPSMWLVLSALMVVPIAMIFLTLALPFETSRWANIVAAVVLLLFNLMGLPSYPSQHGKFLIVVSLIFSGLIAWYAWNWVI